MTDGPATGSRTTARSTTTSSCDASSGRRVPDALGHRGRAARLRAAGARTALDHFRGMFAFALWDEREQKLFCARDRFGIKPFYYAVVGRRPLLRLRDQGAPPVPAARSRPTSRRSRTISASSSASAGKTLFKGVRELPPGHFLRVRDGTSRSAATGRCTTSPTSTTRPSTSRSARRELVEESVDLHLRSRRAGRRVRQRRVRLERVASLAVAIRRRGLTAFTGKFSRGRALRREPLRPRRSPPSAGSTLHEVDIGEHDFVELDRARHLPPRLSGRGARLVPAVHGLRACRAASQGGARRPGRRRDLRRLRPLPDRLLRAVHQGRDRRHDARRQLRRHVRVDHPEPRPRSRRTSRCSRSSGGTGCSTTSTARYFRLVNRANHLGDEVGWDAARRLLAVRDASGDLPRRERRARSRTSTA